MFAEKNLMSLIFFFLVDLYCVENSSIHSTDIELMENSNKHVSFKANFNIGILTSLTFFLIIKSNYKNSIRTMI